MYFSSTETERRVGLLRSTMDDLGLKAVVLISLAPGPGQQEEFYFLQNDYIPAGASVTIMFRDQEPVVVSPYLQSLSHKEFSTVRDSRTFSEFQQPAALVADVLVEKGISSGNVGWRWSSVPAQWNEILASRLPEIAWVDISVALKNIWYQKSTEEAEVGLRSAGLADAGYEHIVNVIEPGMTEWDVVNAFDSHTFRGGANRNFTIVASGRLEKGRSFTELRPATRRVLEAGDCIMLEMTPAVSGYYTQLVRTITIAEPNPYAELLKNVAVSAVRDAAAALRPGATIGHIARTLTRSVEDAGFRTSFPLGHTVGVDLVYDRLLPDLERPLHENDTLIIHPRINTPDGGYAFFWGETYLVTPTGSKRMNGASDELRVAGSTQ